MIPITLPTIKIELEGMRETIVHAFAQRQIELTGQLDAALKQAVEHFDFDGEVRKVAYEVLRDSVKNAVQSAIWKAFNYGTKVDVIEPVIREALIRALQGEDPARSVSDIRGGHPHEP